VFQKIINNEEKLHVPLPAHEEEIMKEKR